MDHVFITGRRKAALDAAVADIGKNVTAVQGDVANLSDLDRLYDAVKKHHRPIDIIFANAGLAKLAPFGTVSEEFFDLHFGANVKGLFFSVQKGLPLMKDGGSIILTGSLADIKGFPAMSATKAAIRSFARTWTNDLRDRRIRVNVLSPGHIDTPIMESLQQGEALTKMKKEMANNVPLGGGGGGGLFHSIQRCCKRTQYRYNCTWNGYTSPVAIESPFRTKPKVHPCASLRPC
jgi:NAD(P)-dependent dehydrogenase (short-subunit alcohol dehydrogenase family)